MIRLDRAGLAAPKSATIFEGRAARTHDARSPLRYADRDEYRDAAELKKLCDRMVGLPVTLGHGGKKVGAVIAARIDGDHLVVQMAVDEAGQKAIKSGAASELSLGYRCDADGGWQTNIDPFELSLVSRARCGATCAVRADECNCGGHMKRNDGTPRLTSVVDGHQHLIDLHPSPNAYDANNTSWAVSAGAENGHSHPFVRNPDGSITIGESAGHTHTILDEKTYAAIRGDGQIDRSASGRKDVLKMSDDKKRADELEGEKKVLEARVAELEALVAVNAAAAESEATKKERERADAADGKVRELEAAFRPAVAARAKLEREALAILGANFRLDDLSDRTVHESVCKRLDGALDVKAMNDDELRGTYRALIARYGANAEATARVGEILNRNAVSQRADEQSEREKRMDEYRNQWRKTIAAPTAAKGA